MGFYIALDIECDNKVNKLQMFLKKIGARDSLVALQTKFDSIQFFFYKYSICYNPNYVEALQGSDSHQATRKNCPLAGRNLEQEQARSIDRHGGDALITISYQ